MILSASLGAFFVWGLLAPRSQWAVLVSWSYRDPYRYQPSSTVFGVYRALAALGVLAVVSTGVAVYQPGLDPQPRPTNSLSPTERMWGAPVPAVVNRVIDAQDTAAVGLVNQPVLGYQAIDGAQRQPTYLFTLPAFTRPDATDANGYIGRSPSPGLTALDTANLVVQVSGDPLCFPQQLILVENTKTVQIGVFYGQPNPSDGSNAVNLANCNPKPAKQAFVSLLIPVRLASPLGSRQLQSLDGKALHEAGPLVE